MTDEKVAAPRVLIVDDEADFGMLVARWLAPLCRAVVLTGGREVLWELEDGGASLLILDVHMPGEDGFEICRRVRADARYAAIPVLFLTGSRDEDIYLRNLNAGGAGYLAKPVGRAQLLNAVAAMIPGLRQEQETGGGD